jgi:ferrochelatase
MTNRRIFLDAGGDDYRYIPALNQAPEHIGFLRDLAVQHLQGWPEANPGYDHDEQQQAAAQSRQRALDLGAEQ